MTPTEAAGRTLGLPNKAAHEGIQTLLREAGFKGGEYRAAMSQAWRERTRLKEESDNPACVRIPMSEHPDNPDESDNPASRVSTGLK